MSDVDIKYKSQVIASMDASGTKTLETGGTYCEDDIVVEYTKSSGADVSGVTATAADVLNPKKFINSSGELDTGAIQTKTTLSRSGATITASAGYYASDVSASVPNGTLNTPTASKGSVSNHSITVTPKANVSVAGYLTSGERSGTAVTVSASELVSGTAPTITANGTNIDVTNYKYVNVSVPTSAANFGIKTTMTYSSSTAGSSTGYYHYRYANITTANLLGFYAYPSYRVGEDTSFDCLIEVFYNAITGDGVVGYMHTTSSGTARCYYDTLSNMSSEVDVSITSSRISISAPGVETIFADDSNWYLIPFYSA